jgi:UDP-N-acetylmuramate dehydrogenase
VGSTFKNPPGRFVAQMVEEAGLKGFAIGGARVSPKHANFFENFQNAKASDVLALVEKVRVTIREKFGVELELEMKVIGEA